MAYFSIYKTKKVIVIVCIQHILLLMQKYKWKLEQCIFIAAAQSLMLSSDTERYAINSHELRCVTGIVRATNE